MDNTTLFIFGLVVMFIFVGGMLIHTIVSQKLLKSEESERSPSEAREE